MTIKRSKKPPKPHNRGFSGKTTKLSFAKFLEYILELNEDNPPDGKRLTDEDIIESATAEFGSRVISVRNLANPYSSGSLSTFRSKYNNGQPTLLSLRYNDDGYPCRNYRHPIDIDKVRTKAFRYRIVDPRVFTVEEVAKLLEMSQDYPEDYCNFRFPSVDEMEKHPYGSIDWNPSVSPEPKTTIESLDLNASSQ